MSETDNGGGESRESMTPSERYEKQSVSLKSLWLSKYESIARSIPDAAKSVGGSIESEFLIVLVTDFGIVRGRVFTDEEERVQKDQTGPRLRISPGAFAIEAVENSLKDLEGETDELTYLDRDWPLILKDVIVNHWGSQQQVVFPELAVFSSSIRAITLGS